MGKNLIYLGMQNLIEPRHLSTVSSQHSGDLHPGFIPAPPIKGRWVFTTTSIKGYLALRACLRVIPCCQWEIKEWNVCKVQRGRLSLWSSFPLLFLEAQTLWSFCRATKRAESPQTMEVSIRTIGDWWQTWSMFTQAGKRLSLQVWRAQNTNM